MARAKEYVWQGDGLGIIQSTLCDDELRRLSLGDLYHFASKIQPQVRLAMRRFSAKSIAVLRAADEVRDQSRLLEQRETEELTKGLLLFLGLSTLGFLCLLFFKLK